MYGQVCKHNVSRMQNLVHVHVYLYKITHVWQLCCGSR